MLEGTYRILTVGTPDVVQQPLAIALAARPELRLHAAADADDVADVARRCNPDLVIVWSAPLAAVVAALPRNPPPVVQALPAPEPEAARRALAEGATDVLRPDLTEEETIARLTVLLSLRRAMAEVERQATVDALTGALARRTFLARATEEVERARRYGHALCLLIADIDGLKAINTGHGNRAGDDALRTVAATCSEVLRESDLLGRLGDDEMAVLLPSTTGAGALALAERLRSALAAAPLVSDGEPFRVTVCIGAAEAGSDSVEVLVGRAEKALAAAQAQGRDQVMLAVRGR